MCYSKTILKTQSSNDTSKKDSFTRNISLNKHVLRFKKLISIEKNLQRITIPKEYMNKSKIQMQVAVTAITFYFVFS